MEPFTVYAVDAHGVRYELTNGLVFRETRPGHDLAEFDSALDAMNAAWNNLPKRWINDPSSARTVVVHQDGSTYDSIRFQPWACLPSKKERLSARKAARRTAAELRRLITKEK